MEARGATEGERKTITALFADIKGSMALIEGLDPEEARAISEWCCRHMHTIREWTGVNQAKSI
jgi:class 3 adenylate cyclase